MRPLTLSSSARRGELVLDAGAQVAQSRLLLERVGAVLSSCLVS